MWGILPVELIMRQLVPTGNPGMLQHLLGRVPLVGIHVQHVWQQVLQGRETQTLLTPNHPRWPLQQQGWQQGEKHPMWRDEHNANTESSRQTGPFCALTLQKAENNVWHYWSSSTEPALMAKQLTVVPFMFIMNITFKSYWNVAGRFYGGKPLFANLSPCSFCTLGSTDSSLQLNSETVRHQQEFFLQEATESIKPTKWTLVFAC